MASPLFQKDSCRTFVGTLPGLLVCAVLPSFAAESGFPAPRPAYGIYFGDPLPWLSEAEQQQFQLGFQVFEKNWGPSDGAGDHFNAESCVSCHRDPLPGGSGSRDDSFILLQPAGTRPRKLSRLFRDETGSVRQLPPPGGVFRRRTPALFGLGLIEVIPAGQIAARASLQPEGMRGRPVWIDGRLGRFGAKANVPDLEEFTEDALHTELGIPTEVIATRLRVDGSLQNLLQYLRGLAPPSPRPSWDPDSRGARLFQMLECSVCHVPEYRIRLETASTKNEEVVIRPYTDLLVHRMGAARSDLSDAPDIRADEFRTAPLWGLASVGPPYLHDGAARSLTDAILMHGGEAQHSADQFKALSAEEKEALLEFLRSL